MDDQFNFWKLKQKRFDYIYKEVIKKEKESQIWKNDRLTFNEKYKLWKKNYAKYYNKKINFYNNLENEIFINNNIALSLQNAYSIF